MTNVLINKHIQNTYVIKTFFMRNLLLKIVQRSHTYVPNNKKKNQFLINLKPHFIDRILYFFFVIQGTIAYFEVALFFFWTTIDLSLSMFSANHYLWESFFKANASTKITDARTVMRMPIVDRNVVLFFSRFSRVCRWQGKNRSVTSTEPIITHVRIVSALVLAQIDGRTDL